MTLSRIAIGVFALALPAQASAQALTAEQALINHRRALSAAGNGCADGPSLDPEEVVVCGRRTGPSLRLPLPVQPEPGARVAGESAAATDGLQPQRCTAWGPNQSCNGGLPLIPIAAGMIEAATKIAEAVIDPD